MILLITFAVLTGIAVGTPDVTRNQFSVGNPQLCKTRYHFPILPGAGFDNLRNKEMNLIVQHNYSRCSTTDDDKYLIPDDVFAIPIKSSKVKTTAELFDHWDSYTSTLSRTINVGAKLPFEEVIIGGKFSDEYESVKKNQYNEKTATTRVQARYLRYEARLSRDVALSDNFGDRVKKIAYYSTLNKTDLARYESHLLVRDYGTHVITSMDVGATLEKIDQVKQQYVKDSSEDKRTVTASASASFAIAFGFGAGFSQTTDATSVDGYHEQVMTSEIHSFGGDMYRPVNFSVDAWIASVDNNMIAIDVSGDPLSYFINDETLPTLPKTTISDVQMYVDEAVALYYKHNTYRGCTDPISPNFNLQSNVDDDTCKPPNTNFTFGGAFQECTSTGYTNLCVNVAQKNPITGGYSCPQGYDKVLLNSGTKSASKIERNCRRCWKVIFKCCNTDTVYANASYSAYWCVAEGPVATNHGLLVGGTFTSSAVNPITEGNTCPHHFYGIRLLKDLTVCVTDDYELGYQFSLPFAGFFTCRSGNPLVVSEERTRLQQKNNPLLDFFQASGPASYPKRCPKGYSQHLVFVDSGCEINYCVKTGALSPAGLRAVQRPPFMKIPRFEMADLDSPQMKISNDGAVWLSVDPAQAETPAHQVVTGAKLTDANIRYENANFDSPQMKISNDGAVRLSMDPAQAEKAATGAKYVDGNENDVDTSSGASRMSAGAAGVFGGFIALVIAAVFIIVVVVARRWYNNKPRNVYDRV